MKTATQDETALQRPTLAEVDAFGLTHPGLVRKTNADHFLVASLHRTLHVHATSLANGLGPQETDLRGVLLVVADGRAGFCCSWRTVLADSPARLMAARARSPRSHSICCMRRSCAHSWRSRIRT